jgi:hypothetical protein
MVDIIRKFKNREFCIDKYTGEVHVILMNEGFEWNSGNNYGWKWEYTNIGVSSGINLTWNSDINKTVESKYFIEQYNKQLSESLYVDFRNNEIEENNMRNFTKDDLVMGKHVVEFKSGETGVYLMNGFNDCKGNPLCSSYCLYDDLTGRWDSDDDVVKVFEIINTSTNESIETKINTTKLVWERENIEKQKLKREMQRLIDKANEIKERIDKM